MTKGYKHGLKGTPEYNAWVAMRQRCNNPHGHDSHYYKGVTSELEGNQVTANTATVGVVLQPWPTSN